MNKQKIIPHLWFNNEVKEAVTFYTNIFPNSSIDQEAIIYGSPGGDADLVSFTIFDYTFMAINGGHNFQKNPSISFTINFYYNGDNSEKKMLIKIWNELASAGKVLMPLQEYSFSKLYGWVEDKFSVSWQLSLIDSKKDINSKRIAPNLMFVDDVCGKAEEATDFYISIFNNSKRKSIHRYPANMEPDKGGTVMYTDLQLEGLLFSATDSARNHQFNFNEGISLLINCDDQDEIDYYWKKLSHDRENEACGWLKDKYGVSWQVSPNAMVEMIKNGTKEQIARVTKAFLPMKKLSLQKLIDAYNNK